MFTNGLSNTKQVTRMISWEYRQPVGFWNRFTSRRMWTPRVDCARAGHAVGSRIAYHEITADMQMANNSET